MANEIEKVNAKEITTIEKFNGKTDNDIVKWLRVYRFICWYLVSKW